MASSQEKKEVLTNTQVCLIVIVGIVAITWLSTLAMLKGIDGRAFAAAIGGICTLVAGAVGFVIKRMIGGNI